MLGKWRPDDLLLFSKLEACLSLTRQARMRGVCWGWLSVSLTSRPL